MLNKEINSENILQICVFISWMLPSYYHLFLLEDILTRGLSSTDTKRIFHNIASSPFSETNYVYIFFWPSRPSAAGVVMRLIVIINKDWDHTEHRQVKKPLQLLHRNPIWKCEENPICWNKARSDCGKLRAFLNHLWQLVTINSVAKLELVETLPAVLAS